MALTDEQQFWDAKAVSDGDPYDPLSDKDYSKLLDIWEMPPSPDSALLEIGCGTGAFGKRVQSRFNCRLTGIDISPDMVANCAFEAVCGDACHLPFENASFDGVIGSGVLHHLPDLNSAIADAARVVRPGGVFFFLEPNSWHPQRQLCMRTKIWTKGVYSPDEQPLSPSVMRKLFLESGFSSADYSFFCPEWRVRTLASRLQSLVSAVSFAPFDRFSMPWFVLSGRK